MTAITILSGDFEILFDDETTSPNTGVGMKMVRRTAGATATVYTTNQLYSAIADAADDFQAMGFENPMLPVTPNAYTMENNYFIPRSSTEWLNQGAISASWAVTAGAGVYMVEYSGGTDFVTADIGREVIQSATHTGTLLDFEVLPDGVTTAAWIRPKTSGDTFVLTGALVVTGGTGSTTTSVAGVSGDTLYASIQAIGSVPTATEVYLVQDRFKMADSTGAFQWWTTDTTVSLGIIDILIRVKNVGTLIADGDVEVFARRYTSLYDNFRLNVSAGGRSALPLASAPDINNTTGYWSGVWSGGGGTEMFIGDLLTNTTGGKEGGKYVVTAVSDATTTGTFEYYNVGDLTEFATTDTFTSANRTGTINGAPTATVGGPTETGAGNGATVTIAIGTNAVDHDGNGVNEYYSVTVDAQTNVAIGTVYEVLKYRTRRGADAADLFGAGTNIPGETYRGLDAIYEYDALAGTMTQGDNILTTTGGNTWTARLMAQNNAASPAYITVTDQQTSTDSIVNDNVVEDEAGGDSVTVHEGGTLGFGPITSPKSSPLGTFTGTQIFGAPGVVYINPLPADAQAYILTDDLGNLNSPPNTVGYVVSNTAAGDRVLVARDTGTTGVIDKDLYGGLVTAGADFNGVGDLKIEVATTIDTTHEVPDSGYVRVVETVLQEEHHYVYDSIVRGANSTFNLRVVDIGDGTADVTDATGPTYNLQVTDSAFATVPVALPGMLVRDTTAGFRDEVWEVVTVTDANNLELVPVYGAPTQITTGHTFEINKLIGPHDDGTTPTDYLNTADVYDLFIDAEATTTSISNTFVKETGDNWGTVVNVRQGKIILPFTQNKTVEDGGASVTVVRTPDTIAN